VVRVGLRLPAMATPLAAVIKITPDGAREDGTVQVWRSVECCCLTDSSEVSSWGVTADWLLQLHL